MQPRRLALGLATLILAAGVHAQDKACSKSDAAAAAKALDNVVTWGQLEKAWRDYRQCDSPPADAQFTEALMRIMVDWKQPEQLGAAVGKDAEYKAFAGAQATTASAAEIKVLCSNGFGAVMKELASQFERDTTRKVAVTYGLAAVLKRQIEAGESFDLAVLTPAAIDDLIKAGRIVAESRRPLARTGLALAIRRGAPKVDVSNVEAFKRALLAAKSIAYTKEGASGVAFAALIERLGIAHDLKTKSRLTATGEEVSQAVVGGEAELGVLPLSEILPVPGLELLGMFPGDAQIYIPMVAGVSSASDQRAAARDLVGFLTAPAALPVIEAKGMEPARP